VRKSILTIVIIGIFLGGLTLFIRYHTVSVHFVLPQKMTAIEAVYGSGTFTPEDLIKVSSEVSGKLIALHVQKNDSITKDQPLAQLDDQELIPAYRESLARLDYAQQHFLRITELYKQRHASIESYELAKSEQQIALTQANIQKRKLEKATLSSPAAGIIVDLQGEVGDYKTAGQPFIYLWANNTPLRLIVDIDERDIARVNINQSVLISTDAYPEQVFKGRVLEITQMGNSETRNYSVKISLDDPSPFFIGMSAEANIIISRHVNALMVPIHSIHGNHIWSVDHGKAISIPIETGIKNEMYAEVLSGINEKTIILLDVPEKIKNGQTVNLIDNNENGT